jgi:Rod binding domain-containing protein
MTKIASPPTTNFMPHKYKEVPKEYLAVAEAMEVQFANHMLGEMRKNINSSEPDSQASQYYNSLLDYERAKIMAEDPKGGLGIKEVILDQILPPHLKQNKESALNAYNRNSQKGEDHE